MPNPFFQFKQFTVYHDRTAMKVTTDACLFGAWCSEQMRNELFHKDNALEIGAGTGLLSLMVAQKNEIVIDAVEIDAAAAEQACENIKASPWKDRLFINHADILQFAPHKQYDCIFSNPPFYEHEIESVSDQKKLAHHGLGLKLDQLFAILSSFIKPEGILQLKKNQFSVLNKTLVRQSVSHQPFRIMLIGTKEKSNKPAKEHIISIWDESRQYTPEFVDLLKDYYLYL
jgi:tRNA1Val (adenine37-N6)-methyltransferase